jgi:hypothetical protein
MRLAKGLFFAVLHLANVAKSENGQGGAESQPGKPRLKATKDTILMRLAVAFVALSAIWVALTPKPMPLAIIGEPRHNNAQIT